MRCQKLNDVNYLCSILSSKFILDFCFVVKNFPQRGVLTLSMCFREIFRLETLAVAIVFT
jgi:hypothetical protein